ncbi:hypothetical protein GCK72_021407 [Caenorhabditis remanei]|uniref:F-box domain-containing protein n=1 Tax=Caenorhabditis remanei TaxID=31234 RepID=A0A6A5GK12_CAERE|nr:hypothetical protein GCK72_021407 [Caenorhabditis remanei]KAF1754842.1 hypothetical protein GCK72_021407 [Caenorhabditis remanei]
MTDDSPLLRLPEIAINHILYFCDYLEIVRLRNVCHSLRNHIDVNKPDAHVKVVRLGERERADILLEFEYDSIILIDYKEAEGGCVVECLTDIVDPPAKIISGLNPMDALIQDFKIYSRHLKTPLRSFTLHEVCCDALLELMRSQTFKLRTAKLELTELSSTQNLAILPFFDANCLKTLKIFTDANDETGEALGVFHELFEMEHWWNAMKIELYNFHISDVRQIVHLKKFAGRMSTATSDDLVLLKNTFIRWRGFERYHINFDVGLDVVSINEAFGAPSFISMLGSVNRWFFHIPNHTASVLLVKVNCRKTLDIGRIRRRKVPSGAVIIY